MQLGHWFTLCALLVVASGCTPIADNKQRRGESQIPVQDQSAPVSGEERAVAGPSSRNSSPERRIADGEQTEAASVPFIAETTSPVAVINVMSPGRLEVVNGCLTVSVRGSEPLTAVFPPGVKPELKGNAVVAVFFEGRRIPLGQETPIPGGGIRLKPGDLVKPLPPYCPKTLFGLGG